MHIVLIIRVYYQRMQAKSGVTAHTFKGSESMVLFLNNL